MGTYTIISGSLMLPEVRQAIQDASKAYVHLDELMEQGGCPDRGTDGMRMGHGHQRLRRRIVPGHRRLRGGPRSLNA